MQKQIKRIENHRRKSQGIVYRCMRCKKEYPDSRYCCGVPAQWWSFKKAVKSE